MNTLAHNTYFSSRAPALIAALAFAGLTFATGPALAADVEVLSQAVKYGDLNLGHTAGAATLYGRIKSAAAHVCANDSSRELRVTSESRSCMKQAIARAVADVNQPQLTQYYLVKTGQAAPGLAVASANP